MRDLDAEGVSGQRLQEIFGTGHSTFARDVGPRPRPKRHTKSSVMEAGLAWEARYGIPPTSISWNSALSARDHEDFARWLAGYRPVATPDEWRPWPLEKVVRRFYKTFPDYIHELRDEIGRRRRAQDWYQPVPQAANHELYCELGGFLQRLPAQLVSYVDAFTYRVWDFKVLLRLIGGEVAYKIIEWLDDRAPPPIPAPRWFEARVPSIPIGSFCLPRPISRNM